MWIDQHIATNYSGDSFFDLGVRVLVRIDHKDNKLFQGIFIGGGFDASFTIAWIFHEEDNSVMYYPLKLVQLEEEGKIEYSLADLKQMRSKIPNSMEMTHSQKKVCLS